MTSTWRALRPSGGRNPPTASDTASIPVSDAPPLAKARRKVKTVTPRTSVDTWCTLIVPCRASGSSIGRWKKICRISPTTIIRTTDPENR